MSIDVNYYSFSPARADKRWPEFIEDIKVLRAKIVIPEPPSHEALALEKKIETVKAEFETRRVTLRKKIFDFFKHQDRLMPWIEWDEEEGVNRFGGGFHASDEDKLEYLRTWGPTYPRGADLKDKNVHGLILKIHAPELNEEYDRLIQERDKTISDLYHQMPVPPIRNPGPPLTKRQEALEDGVDLSYLQYEIEFDKKQLLQNLKELDIYYGSTINEYFENPRTEYANLGALVKTFDLKVEKDVPLREEWIRLFQDLNRETLNTASDLLAKEFNWSADEAASELMDFLRSVRPVAEDLKHNPDAVFLRSYGGDPAVDPESAEELLLERAKKHAKEFKGLLPPVV